MEQGQLNRVIASVSWPNFPNLNVTAPYLGRDGISLSIDGESTTFLGTMTGAVTSPEVLMMITCTMHLLKTQALAQSYKVQMELLSTIGNGVVRPDVTTGIGDYDITNCAIGGVRELRLNGADEGWVVTIRGYYLINSSLFDAA